MILFAEASEKTIVASSSSRSGKFVERLYPEETSPNGRIAEDKFKELMENNPLLQISLPEISNEINANSWDLSADIPIVAYVPAEDQSENIQAFDADGRQYTLSRRTRPNRRVIVISENERLIAIPKSKNSSATTRAAREPICPMIFSYEPYYSTESTDYFFRSDYYEACDCCYYDPEPVPPNPIPTSTCDRTRKTTKDYLVRIKFNSDSDLDFAEEWINGAPELRMIVTFGAPNAAGFGNLSKSLSKLDRSRYKDCGLFSCKPEWAPINVEILTWDKAQLGDKMKYTWIEEDSGDTVEGTVTLQTSFTNSGTTSTVTNSVKYTKSDKDDNLGESVVEFCDNTDGDGTSYNTGKLQFFVNQ